MSVQPLRGKQKLGIMFSTLFAATILLIMSGAIIAPIGYKTKQFYSHRIGILLIGIGIIIFFIIMPIVGSNH
jgi:hypothetical protein